jgi:hypothetical protein
MNTKQRYKLRQRLQAALADLVMVIADLDHEHVGPNLANVAGIELARRFLDIALRLPRPRSGRRPPADAITATVAKVEERRRRETAARRRRRDRSQRRQAYSDAA